MADQHRYFRLWCTAPTDSGLLSMSPADRWAWAALGCYTKQHGTRGVLTVDLTRGDGALAALALYMGVRPDEVEETVSRMPNIDVQRSNGKIACRWRKWHRYQTDPTGAERSSRKRSSRPLLSSPLLSSAVRGGAGGGVPRGTQKPPCHDCSTVLETVNRYRSRDRVGGPLSLVGPGAGYLHARHRERGLPACLTVVAGRFREWAGDEKMRKHLTLDTMFRPGNFDRYAADAMLPLDPASPPPRPTEEEVASVDLEAAREKRRTVQPLSLAEAIALQRARGSR